MKQGRTLVEWASEIQRQQAAKIDYIAASDAIEVRAVGANAMSMSVRGGGVFPVRDTAHALLAGALDIPSKYYRKMLADAPSLLAANVNTWLGSFRQDFGADVKRSQKMVRLLDGGVRAVLSGRYRRIDNYDLAQATLPVFADFKQQHGNDALTIQSAELTPERCYIKASYSHLTGEVKKGDIVSAGVEIRNSEIGYSRAEIRPMLFRLICLNGATMNEFGTRATHVGRAAQETDEAYQFYSAETLNVDDRAFWMKFQDTLRGTLTEVMFARMLDRARAAADRAITVAPNIAVERLAQRNALSEEETGGILGALTSGMDLSAWGLTNAVTRFSQDVPDYGRATELEGLGGRILTLSPQEWSAVAA